MGQNNKQNPQQGGKNIPGQQQPNLKNPQGDWNKPGQGQGQGRPAGTGHQQGGKTDDTRGGKGTF